MADRPLKGLIEEMGDLTRLATMPGATPKFPGTKFSVQSEATWLSLNVNGPGIFKMSLRASEDWLRSELHVDMVLGITAPYGPLEGGMRRTTGPDGTIADSPIHSVPQPLKEPGLLELMKKRDGPMDGGTAK